MSRSASGDYSVLLDGPVDAAGFRRAARRLYADGIAPDRVEWRTEESSVPALFGGEGAADAGPRCVDDNPAFDRAGPTFADAGVAGYAPNGALQVPRSFQALTDAVVLHRDPGRFGLLYTLLWRLQREPALRHDPLDAMWMRADRMAHAVRLGLHKMKAFVRFRPIERGPGEPALHVAWFEPEHHIVEAVAPFFVQRFAQLRWAVLTPLRSVDWDGDRLTFGPGARQDQAPPADAGEGLWLTYYAHIFNPARLKLAMMRKEMPRRYWKNLPEAVLIEPLAARAHERSADMIAQQPSEPQRVVRPLLRPSAVRLAPAPVTPLLAPGTGERTADERHAALVATHRAAGSCSRCPLHRDATQTVFGEGPIDAPLMFVGEQPGDREDLQGHPFVGPSGQLFDRALATLQLDRQQVYVTNAVKHFKFELRGQRRIHKTAAQQEAAACIDWLEAEIALVAPPAVVALGATAARSLLGRSVAVMRERGHWFFRDDGLPVLVTLHPSALLRLPASEHEAAVKAWLADLAHALRPPPRSPGVPRPVAAAAVQPGARPMTSR